MYAKKSLGQNFLTNSHILENIYKEIKNIIVDKNIKQIVEIGPGHGELTKYIIRLKDINKEIKILCIEKDHNLVDKLQKKIDSVSIIEEDALLFDYNKINTSYILVGNIPYYISGHIFKKIILYTSNKPAYIIFMLQKELAQKIESKKSNKLNILINSYGKVIKSIDVNKNNFRPIPKVDSKIVIIEKCNEKKYTDKFWKFINIAFSSPRKKLVNNLLNIYDANTIKNVFDKLNLDKNIRGEALNIDELSDIYNYLQNHTE